MIVLSSCPGSPSAVLSCILRDGQSWWIGEPRTRHPCDGTAGAVYSTRSFTGQNPLTCLFSGPAKYQLTINLKTAKALGLTIPLPLLARADAEIE